MIEKLTHCLPARLGSGLGIHEHCPVSRSHCGSVLRSEQSHSAQIPGSLVYLKVPAQVSHMSPVTSGGQSQL